MNATGRWLLLIVGVAIVARLLFAGLVVGFGRAPFGDETDYHHIASNLASGGGYALESGTLTARRPPLYPVLLSALYRIVGPRPPAARLLQTFLGGAIVWLVFLVARRYFSQRTAWWAAAAAAANPFLIFISGYMLTENLYIVILLGMLWAAPRPDAISSWRAAAAVGILAALAALARPTGFIVGEWVLAAYLVFGRSTVLPRISRGAVLAGAALLVMLPWTVRNYRAFGRPIMLTTHGGITFYQGNNPRVFEVPQYRGGVAPLEQLPGHEALEGMTALQRDDAAWAMGKQFLRENKSKIPLLAWNKFRRLWRFHSEAGLSGIKSGWWFGNEGGLGKLASSLDLGFLYAIVAIPLFVFGLIVTWRRWRELVFIYGILVCHTAATLVFHGSLRMRSPMEPVIAIMAAEALLRIVDRLRGRRTLAADDRIA